MFQRFLDVILSTVVLLLSLPFLLLVFVFGVRLFLSHRLGVFQRPFTLYKLKTMRDPLPHEDPYLSESKRITPLGRWLRYFSLDEWPQWWNILKGDMTIIGPRPLPVDFLEHISQQYHLRFQVKPGLTGWAQVNGRNALSFERKLELDCWYVANRSLLLDLEVLLRTPLAMFNNQINPERAPGPWRQKKV